MNCQRFRLDMLEYIANGKDMPGKLKEHLSNCADCRSGFNESQRALKDFLQEESFEIDKFTGVDAYIKSIMPGINKKSACLEQQKQQRLENIIFAAMIAVFLKCIILIAYTYIASGNPWLLYLSMLYIVIASIVSVLIIPQFKREI